MKKLFWFLFILCWGGLATTSAIAAVRLPNVFTDHMVLQRDRDIKVWGWAAAGERVKVQLAGQAAETTADAQGGWKVKLPPMKAGGPHAMTVAGENTITIGDVLLGEIWVCSGQSNMEFEMMHVQNSKEEISRADYPQLRMLLVPRTTSAVPLNDVKTSWAICSPASEVLPKFSAVAYFFGREILTNLKVPVGLMAASQGATQIEPWTAHEGVAEGGALYNGMIHPLVPFAIRGAIWYQGESNCGDGMRYFDKMKALVSGWRRVWQQGDFPFYFVQITPNRYDGALPLLIESQIASMTIPNTGMAQSTDTTNPSDNFGGGHPRNKQEIGRRLALWALAKDYGQINLVHSGPRFQSLKAEGSHLRISFDQVGGGLITRDNKAPDSFEIAGPDGVFVEATARIDGATVIVSSEKVAQPKAMRFAWTDLAQPNLMIKDGLPVSQFRAQVP